MPDLMHLLCLPTSMLYILLMHEASLEGFFVGFTYYKVKLISAFEMAFECRFDRFPFILSIDKYENGCFFRGFTMKYNCDL